MGLFWCWGPIVGSHGMVRMGVGHGLARLWRKTTLSLRGGAGGGGGGRDALPLWSGQYLSDPA